MIRDVAETLADLVLPAPCAGCGEPSRSAACARCLSTLARPRLLHRAARPSAGPPAVLALADWSGPLRSLVIGYKERGRTELARPLGAVLAPAVAAVAAPGSRSVLVVPIPSRRAVRRRRGHDPVRALTGVAARRLRAAGHDAVAFDLLRHRRAVADQAGLTAAERAANLDGAIAVSARRAAAAADWLTARSGVLVLVDDVVTTGSTLAEGSRALHAAGLQVHGAAVLGAAVLGAGHPR